MIKKSTLSKKTKTITDNNNGARTVMAVFLVSNLSTKAKKPIGNGIITALNKSQAKKRSNLKGQEAANAVLEVIKNG